MGLCETGKRVGICLQEAIRMFGGKELNGMIGVLKKIIWQLSREYTVGDRNESKGSGK